MKTPNLKLQIPMKLQLPNFKLRRARLIQCLEFGVWNLFGAWNLGFGALADHGTLTTDDE
jgi:hypothetical protein